VGERTSIEWTDATANFWRGCDKVSPGCAECYMFRDQRRYGRDPSVVVRCSPVTFNAPLSLRWRAQAAELLERERRRLRVFTCSWSDFFHEDADPWRADAWDVIRACPEYDWQILTKRPELVLERLPPDWGDGWPHVWLGVSIENRRFVHRADQLRALPAAVRFISAEPLLGPLLAPWHHFVDAGRACAVREWPDGFDGPSLNLDEIDWLIVGGESGGPLRRRLIEELGAPRSDRVQWVRELRDECRTLGAGGMRPHPAFLFKQWGGARPESGGRLLDGRTWDEFPLSPAEVGAC
jgi:protein gp37